MEERLGFLTKARRELPNQYENITGPGEYNTINNYNNNNLKPNFAPFCSTSKRELSVPQSTTPSPGTYQINEDSSKVKSVAAGTIFKSKAKRFVPEKAPLGPGPGTYVLQPAIQVKKAMRRSRSQPSHLDTLRNLSTQASAPSIPTKFQSFGYEETEDGNLRLQEPLRPGFTGLKNDHVGPGDYDPKIVDSLHPRAPSSLFHKGAPRVVGEKPSDIPGPGYYNHKSTFEFPDDNGNEGNFYLRFNQASTRQLSSFESTTQRPSITGKKVDPNEPGPGTYNIPRNGVELKKHEVKIQCFDSTVDRFQNSMPRSQRIKTHPGSYNPLTSDFEKNRIDILKKKRMLARSGWAQNISFESTEERFHDNGPKPIAPPPGTYTPKTALVDHLPKENPRSGAFGSTLKRFYNPPSTIQSPNVQSEEIENGFSAYNESRDGIGSREKFLNRSHSPPKPIKQSRPFANNEERFAGKKDITNAPPPGTYDKPLSWKTSGVLKIKEHKTKSLPRPEINNPGPGDYNVGTNLLHKNKMNPHFIMGGSNERFRIPPKSVSPGPGDYDPTPFIGTLNRPTYNSIMADEAAVRM